MTTPATSTPATSSTSSRATAILGLLTAVLLVGHLLPLYVLHGGVAGPTGLDWNTLAARWAQPLWRIWDLTLVLVGCGYPSTLLVRWWNGRPDRTVSTICYAILILAVAAAGVLGILTTRTSL